MKKLIALAALLFACAAYADDADRIAELAAKFEREAQEAESVKIIKQADEAKINNNEQVKLNAERVFFNDITGRATAEGDAELNYSGIKINAERIDYDADSQKVEAMPLPNEKVKIAYDNKVLEGEHLNYDLDKREGVLQGAATRFSLPDNAGSLYIYGREIEVLPWDEAVNRGMVHAKHRDIDNYIAQWKNVVLTTCVEEHPHYRLESKSISFIPGKRVIAKTPRLYLGDLYIMSVPWDYVIDLNRKAISYSILPYLSDSNKKGFGGGVTGNISWGTGSFSLGFAYGSKIGDEWLFELNQELSDEFRIILAAAYSWDEVWDETIWRPRAGLVYEKNDWQARFNWARSQFIEDQKDSRYKYKGRLDTDAELIVTSPWFITSKYSWLKVIATAGSYVEETASSYSGSVARYGAALNAYLEYPAGDVILFSNSSAGAYFYNDDDNSDQESYRSFTGAKYNFGRVELGTAYERRYSWGDSPMFWDDYRDRERIHQKIKFPVGREFYLNLRGSYDLADDFVDEAMYALEWVVDCMRWSLYFDDDMTDEDDDRLGLSVALTAMPERQASFGQDLNEDPFDRPEGIKSVR